MTKTELKELMEKAKAATPGPWQERIWHGPLECDSGLINICFMSHGPIHERQKIEQHEECLSSAVKDSEFISAANPKVVLDLCERVIGLSEALEYYSDREEWIDYKAVGLASNGEFCRVASKFDHDAHGETARHALERYGVKNET